MCLCYNLTVSLLTYKETQRYTELHRQIFTVTAHNCGKPQGPTNTSVQFYNTSSVYHTVYSPPKGKTPITIYLTPLPSTTSPFPLITTILNTLIGLCSYFFPMIITAWNTKEKHNSSLCKHNLECMELKDIVSNNTLLYLDRNGDYVKQKAILKEANLLREMRCKFSFMGPFL